MAEVKDNRKSEGGDGEGISNEEAAERLLDCVPLRPAQTIAELKNKQARNIAIAALRRIGPLEEENETLKKRWGGFLRFLVDSLQLHISHGAFTMIRDEVDRLEGEG